MGILYPDWSADGQTWYPFLETLWSQNGVELEAVSLDSEEIRLISQVRVEGVKVASPWCPAVLRTQQRDSFGSGGRRPHRLENRGLDV